MKATFPKEYLAQELKRVLEKSNLNKIKVTELQQQQLLEFLELFHKWNKAYNLTSVREPFDMLVRHIFDSIAVQPFIKGSNIIDVGTGPGLPGLPLAIINPDKKFYLLDSLGKRITFIRQVVHLLKLKNVEPVQSRVEKFKPKVGFDIVLSRAFASLEDMLNWCHHLPSEQGCFIALKGQISAEEIAQVKQPFVIKNIFSIEVPELEAERHVVEIIKNKSN